MYRFLFVFALGFIPLGAMAEGAATSTVTVNVRYQDSVVFSSPVEVAAPATALMALQTADVASPDFSISDLVYYSRFDSYYVNCINIVSLSQNACGLWQYVVNSTYPPVGMDKYEVSSGDIVYVYYGNSRRVTLSSPSTEASSAVTARTESYDYTNNSWLPLPGAVLGATQPNPDDPYSPTIILSATSDENGSVNIVLSSPGTYNIGLEMDFYSIGQDLAVLPASGGGPLRRAERETETEIITEILEIFSPEAISAETSSLEAPATETTTENQPIVSALWDPDKVVIVMERVMSAEELAENYKIALEVQEIIRKDLIEIARIQSTRSFAIAEEPQTEETLPISEENEIDDIIKQVQAAAVVTSGDSNPVGGFWAKIRTFFGSDK